MSSALDAASACNQIETLAQSDRPVDTAEVVKLADRLVTALPHGPKNKFCLRDLARIVCARTLPQLRLAFGKLFYLHLLYPHLQVQLAANLRSQDMLHFAVPDWWPVDHPGQAAAQDVHQWSVWDFYHNLDHMDGNWCADPAVITTIVETLNVLCALTREPKSTRPYRSLARLLLLSALHRDIVTILALHDEQAVAQLVSCSASPGSTDFKTYSQLVVTLLTLKASMAYTLAAVERLPGAVCLVSSCSKLQHSALSLAASSPFRFVMDLLNLGNHVDTSLCKILVPCMVISSYNIALLCGDHSRRVTLYNDFNQCSSTHSLLAVLADFGFRVAKSLLQNYGYDLSAIVSSVTQLAPSFAPVAKPNYLFEEWKSPDGDSAAHMLHVTDELEEMHKSVFYTLKAINRVLPSEILQVLQHAPTLDIAEKLIVRNLQKLLCFLLAVSLCAKKENSSGSTAKFIAKEVAHCIGQMFTTLSAQKSLIWITLFNFANDICYTEIEMVPIFERLFDDIIVQCDINNEQDLVSSGVRLFASTFGAACMSNPLVAGTPQSVEEGSKTRNVPKDEYDFLYRPHDSTKNRELFSSANSHATSTSGRLQSVHVDKFGK